MDTEKYLEIEKKAELGLSPNDEGPFYHHSWWESYKGSIKGKLGGAIIGGLMGILIGGAVAGALALITALIPEVTISAGVIGMAFAGIAATGMGYGVYEFSEIGKIVGAQAAGLEQADAREAIRFAALEQRIDKLTEAVNHGQGSGKDSAKAAEILNQPVEDYTKELETYRTTHYAQLHPDRKNRYFFGKVVAIGLAVGVAAGALLAIGGVNSAAAHFFSAIGIKIGAEALTAAGMTAGGLMGIGITVASVITFGMFGASFGLNRDIFRRIFDKTDLWTKGIVFHKKLKEQQIAAGQDVENEYNGKNGNDNEIKKGETPKKQDAYAPIAYPESDTYYQDKVLAAAEKSLLSFDHTRATPH